ncbi:CPCC family cysteine-rich protein [Streptomyces sp. NPDC059766]|uniref:CPCC family cysteine-rich protein n=1 Tax=Streptomyces sp. NPDC059766 TaxID=3346940 RepID=UPI00365711DF
MAQRNAPTAFADVIGRAENGPYCCPCCGFVTLAERAMYAICPVCFWEDDGQDDHDADECRGGPNGRLSLTEARRNFEANGSCSGRGVSHRSHGSEQGIRPRVLRVPDPAAASGGAAGNTGERPENPHVRGFPAQPRSAYAIFRTGDEAVTLCEPRGLGWGHDDGS